MDCDKYNYSESGIGFDAGGSFLLSNSSGFVKNMIIFRAEMSSTRHIDNKKKAILILGNDPTVGLDDTTLTPDKEYLINFTVEFY